MWFTPVFGQIDIHTTQKYGLFRESLPFSLFGMETVQRVRKLMLWRSMEWEYINIFVDREHVKLIKVLIIPNEHDP